VCNGSGLACGDGLCVQCGGAGQRCCNGGGCNSGCCDPDNIQCIANGAACASGATCANSMCPTTACNPTMMFMDFTTGANCTVPTDCAIALHKVDCCGSQNALGIRMDQVTAFNTAETAWDATCTACMCTAQPIHAQAGGNCAMANITVNCDGGMCRTRCN
jgi:hypothetical protein